MQKKNDFWQIPYKKEDLSEDTIETRADTTESDIFRDLGPI